MTAVTIVCTRQQARYLGARGANGLERMPDDSYVITLGGLRHYGAGRGFDITAITLADGVELTDGDRQILAPAMIQSGLTWDDVRCGSD